MYKILLAEDDSALRYVYSKMTSWLEHGFEIAAEVSNGRAALELLEKEKFDLVFTDIRMPLVDGLTLLKEIKKRQISVFSILVSSYNEFEYARQGLILGAFDFIVKPMTEESLSEVLERAKIYLAEHEQTDEIDGIVSAAAQRCGFSPETAGIVKRSCVYLSRSMGRVITMEELSDQLNISKDYFGKSFKQLTGVTFSVFYTAVKIEYAKRLISTGGYKNYEIAEMLGYSDADYFTKVFRDTEGCTLAQYKKKIMEPADFSG